MLKASAWVSPQRLGGDRCIVPYATFQGENDTEHGPAATRFYACYYEIPKKLDFRQCVDHRKNVNDLQLTTLMVKDEHGEDNLPSANLSTWKSSILHCVLATAPTKSVTDLALLLRISIPVTFKDTVLVARRFWGNQRVNTELASFVCQHTICCAPANGQSTALEP